jgi:hypothetical protein
MNKVAVPGVGGDRSCPTWSGLRAHADHATCAVGAVSWPGPSFRVGRGAGTKLSPASPVVRLPQCGVHRPPDHSRRDVGPARSTETQAAQRPGSHSRWSRTMAKAMRLARFAIAVTITPPGLPRARSAWP